MASTPRCAFVLIVSLLLPLSRSAEAQSYKVFAGKAVLDSATNSVVVNNCLDVSRYAVSPDGHGVYALTPVGFQRLNPSQCFPTEDFQVPGFSDVVMAPNGRDLYGLDQQRSVLVAFDTLTKRYVLGGPLGFPFSVFIYDFQGPMIQPPVPGRMLMAPDGTSIYLNSGGGAEHQLRMISTATMEAEFVATNVAPFMTLPGSMAVLWSATPFDRRLYVANSGRTSLSVFNARTLEFLSEIPVSSQPTAIAVNPVSKRAYVGMTSTDIAVIDTTTNTVVATIPLPAGDAVHAMTLTPDGKSLYISRMASTVVVIDTASNSVRTTHAIDRPVADIAAARLTFSEFTATATFASETSTLAGSFVLGAGANGFDLATDDLALSIGRRTLWIQAGSWTADPNLIGAFRFESPVETAFGATYVTMTIRPGTGPGEHRIEVMTQSMNPGTPDLGSDSGVVQAVLLIGDDGGTTALATASGLEETISDLRSALAASEAQVAALTSDNAALESELADARGRIADLTVQLANLKADLAGQIAALQAALRAALNDATFVVPGATPEAQVQNLIRALGELNPGQQRALYKNLGGKK